MIWYHLEHLWSNINKPCLLVYVDKLFSLLINTFLFQSICFHFRNIEEILEERGEEARYILNDSDDIELILKNTPKTDETT
jgi:hypothetical protein